MKFLFCATDKHRKDGSRACLFCILVSICGWDPHWFVAEGKHFPIRLSSELWGRKGTMTLPSGTVAMFRWMTLFCDLFLFRWMTFLVPCCGDFIMNGISYFNYCLIDPHPSWNWPSFWLTMRVYNRLDLVNNESHSGFSNIPDVSLTFCSL